MQYILGTLILSIFFFGLFFVISLINYNFHFKRKYNLLNMFPYETHYNMTFSKNVYGNVSMILFAIASIAFFISFGVLCDKVTVGWKNAIMILGIIYSVLIACLIFIPLTYSKIHIFIMAASTTVGFSLPCLLVFSIVTTYSNYMDIKQILCVIFASIVAVLIFIIFLNPNLNKPIKYKIEYDEKGNQIPIRPKLIPMAFLEWVITFSFLIDMILSFVISL